MDGKERYQRRQRNPGRTRGRDYVEKYAALCLLGFTAFLVVAYVGAFYLRLLDAPRAASFLAEDWPANAGGEPNNVFAVGVHYFGDYLPTWLQSTQGSPYIVEDGAWPSNYLPVVHVLFRPLVALPYRTSLIVYLVFSAFAILGPMWVALRRRHTPTTALLLLLAGIVLTGPFISVIDRGNIQGIVTGFVIAAALLLASRRNLLAAVCIGLAGALKGYPIILIVILLHRRRWRESLVALGTFALASALALLTFRGGLPANLTGLWDATSPFRNLNVGKETVGPAYNVSMYSLLQVADSSSMPLAGFLLSHYAAVALFLVAVTVAIACLPRATLVERLLVLCGFVVLAPTITGAYTLTLFFAPIAVLAWRGPGNWRLPTVYAILLAALMVPKNFMIDHGATLASVVNPMLMLTIIAVVTISVSLRASGKRPGASPNVGVEDAPAAF